MLALALALAVKVLAVLIEVLQDPLEIETAEEGVVADKLDKCFTLG
jgi:hypothetical protein